MPDDEIFIMPLGPWTEIDAVPDGYVAVIPQGEHAGILYKVAEGERPLAVAFLWANNGHSLPGWRSNITFGSHVPDKAGD